MLNREVIAVCSQIHKENVSTLLAEPRIAEYLASGTYSDHWALKG
jgi:hypothetical protein